MNLILALVARFLGQQDKRSPASVLYQEAHTHGTVSDRLREKIRRGLRELLVFYILTTVVLILYLHENRVPEDQTALFALLAAGAIGPGCWAIYRLIRFAIAR